MSSIILESRNQTRHLVRYKGHKIAEANLTPSGLWEITPSRRYYRGIDTLTRVMNEHQITDFAKKASYRGEPL